MGHIYDLWVAHLGGSTPRGFTPRRWHIQGVPHRGCTPRRCTFRVAYPGVAHSVADSGVALPRGDTPMLSHTQVVATCTPSEMHLQGGTPRGLGMHCHSTLQRKLFDLVCNFLHMRPCMPLMFVAYLHIRLRL